MTSNDNSALKRFRLTSKPSKAQDISPLIIPPLSSDRIYMKNALTIDVEEFFQVHALSNVIKVQDWEEVTSSVESNTSVILDLLNQNNIKATFFCLGWIAERNKSLIRCISESGHEVASHGYAHQVIYSQTPEIFREDVSKSKKIIEDIIGRPVLGYRAPTYSITQKTFWALDILEQLGFTYDSSIFPVHHDNYGIPSAPRFPYRIKGSKLVEFPISTFRLGKLNFPVAGGGYFRLFPYLLTKLGLKTIEREARPFVFYIHPWEFNPDTPKVAGLSALSWFRTYVNLSKTMQRFRRLISDFPFSTVQAVLTEINLLKS
jgi:polysaccharide deacetylase family protein (PEP-CTERM system associated)